MEQFFRQILPFSQKSATFATIITINFEIVMTLNVILAIFNLGTGEIIAIVLVILLLFGGRKIPELMRGIGKGVKSFRQGMNEVEEEIKKPLEETDKDKPGSRPDNPIR
jgi:sec-independent protein translocase protein TatA